MRAGHERIPTQGESVHAPVPPPPSQGREPVPQPSQAIQRRLTVALKLTYLVTSALFWMCGALAFAFNFAGAARLSGLAYLPILALPLVGRGSLAGVGVKSFLWWGWFGFDMALAWLLMLVNLRPDRRPQAS